MRYADGRIAWRRNPEAEACMERLCRTMLTPDVIDAFEAEYGVRLTKWQVKSFRAGRGIRSGLVGGRFERGHVPANKGRTWDEFMSPEAQERSRRTCFKPGEVSGAAKALREPVGAEVLRGDGHVYVKVSDEVVSVADYGDRREAARVRMGRWRPRSRVNYELAHGPVPEGCMVFHADGDPQNDDPENLVAVPLRLRATIARLGNPYADRETLETAMLMAEVLQRAGRASKGGAE